MSGWKRTGYFLIFSILVVLYQNFDFVVGLNDRGTAYVDPGFSTMRIPNGVFGGGQIIHFGDVVNSSAVFTRVTHQAVEESVQRVVSAPMPTPAPSQRSILLEYPWGIAL